ncbi:MAG: sugar kinase [Sphingopyxis sp.]|nr:sugar kinase [Sphingopyxis sp.]
MELVSGVADTSGRIVAFGECMIELSRPASDAPQWNQAFAGDSYNVAVYLQRLASQVDYMTAVGRDPFSTTMMATWSAEGMGTALALRHPDRVPGLYAILLDGAGERSFQYWRDQSAARAFFDCPGAEAALTAASTARLLYLSGITLSLFTPAERARIAAFAATVRANGGDVAFDSNYRARGWTDVSTARGAIDDFARYVSIALPTLDDDCALYGAMNAEACAERWLHTGVREVAVKLGAAGAYIADRHGGEFMPAEEVAQVRDTTGAGDSFNAAYLAARLAGAPANAAARSGHRLASTVVQHPGAIVPLSAMPAMEICA